jgi:GNAT superfamily N-acetyltransferase
MRINEIISEAFDKPYKILRWENSEHYGDVDAIARLDDNTFLSIMFNMEYDEEGEEVIQVEFHRNNSQEVTGDGDAQRVFATVLAAIQQYIKEHNPKRLTFSASKEVEPDQNRESRAKLYDRLVQRYARTWGYRPFRADTGSIVRYELSRIKPVAEGREKFNQEVMRPGFRWSEEISGITYLVRTQWDNMPEVIARVNNREIARATFINHHTRSGLESVSTYVSPKWQGHGIAKNMYAVMRMLGANIQPSATQTAMGKDMWAKWKKSGDTKHLTSMNAKPEQQDMAENFADGKTKGKSRPGRVERSGASCDGSVSDLRSKAKNASGERAKMYHWCANMKSGRK